MPYYRRVGDVPRKRHIRFPRPDGGLHSEELMGVEGFSAESALLYHRQPPTAIVKAEAVDEAPAAAEVTANRPLLPRHLRTHALPAGGDAVTGRRLLLEARGHIRPPRKYLSPAGQFLEHAPYCERDLRAPTEPLVVEDGETPVLVRTRDGLTRYTYRHHPFDVVGWDGCLYPYAFNI